MNRTIIKIMAIVALVIGMTLAPPAKADAYVYGSYSAWSDKSVGYCSALTNSTHHNIARAAIERWNGLSQFRFVYLGGCSTVTSPQVRVVYSSSGPLGAGGQTVVNGTVIAGTIYININRVSESWWSTGGQSCTTPNCKADAYTWIMHEAGHVVGLGHTGGEVIRCGNGYSFYHDEIACDDIGERIMYTAAADGYRRETTSDDINGIRSRYGAP